MMNFGNLNRKLLRKVWEREMEFAMLGGDPEFFVANKKGKILPADKFLPSKYKPYKVNAISDSKDKEWQKNRIYFDGIQAEMAVAPCTCREDLLSNFYNCLRGAERKIGTNQIILKPSVKVDFKTIEEADPEARIFGCDPDFNAYTLTQNTPEMDASRHPYRYAGGHIHLGIIKNYLEEIPENQRVIAMEPEGHIRLVKFLDVMVGIPALLLDNVPGSKRRRSKYGKAGCFRPTPYGIEYRTLSCWWLKSPITASLVYGLARMAWSLCIQKLDEEVREAAGCAEEDIRGILDSGDVKAATKLWENHLGPHIAGMYSESENPLHIGAFTSPDYAYLDPKWEPLKGSRPSLLAGRALDPKEDGLPVFTLAAFEYMRKNGIHSVINEDVKTEWDIDQRRALEAPNSGMVEGLYEKLRFHPDFHKFQESFLGAF